MIQITTIFSLGKEYDEDNEMYENLKRGIYMYWGDYVYHILAISGGIAVGAGVNWLALKILKNEKPIRNN